MHISSFGSSLPIPLYAKFTPASDRCCVEASAKSRPKHGDICLRRNTLLENRLLPNEEMEARYVVIIPDT